MICTYWLRTISSSDTQHNHLNPEYVFTSLLGYYWLNNVNWHEPIVVVVDPGIQATTRLLHSFSRLTFCIFFKKYSHSPCVCSIVYIANVHWLQFLHLLNTLPYSPSYWSSVGWSCFNAWYEDFPIYLGISRTETVDRNCGHYDVMRKFLKYQYLHFIS